MEREWMSPIKRVENIEKEYIKVNYYLTRNKDAEKKSKWRAEEEDIGLLQ